MKTLYSIQFLRGIAALLVVFGHALHELGIEWPGAIGVDIFFIISGFIMVYTTHFDKNHFLLKRIIRICPLYWSVTLIVFFVTIISPTLLKTAYYNPHLFLSSLFFFPLYTKNQFLPLVSLGWTLNFEMFFYLVFQLSLFLSHRLRTVISSISITGLVLLLILLKNLGVISPDSPLTFYANTIMLEFVLGMILAQVYLSGCIPKLPKFTPIISVICFIFALQYLPSDFRFLIWGIPCLFLFISAIQHEDSFHRFRGLKQLSKFLGDTSYGTYLFHMFLIGICSRLLQNSNKSILFGVAMTTPFIIYPINLYFEKPIASFLRTALLRNNTAKN